MNDPISPVDTDVVASLEELERASARPFLAQLVETFLRDAPERIGALRLALAGPDRTALRLEAHGLKGSAAALGVVEVVSIAAALEAEAATRSPGELAEALVALAAALTRAEPALRSVAARSNDVRGGRR